MIINPIGQRTRASMRGVLVILCAVVLAAVGMWAELGSAPLANAQSPSGTAVEQAKALKVPS